VELEEKYQHSSGISVVVLEPEQMSTRALPDSFRIASVMESPDFVRWFSVSTRTMGNAPARAPKEPVVAPLPMDCPVCNPVYSVANRETGLHIIVVWLVSRTESHVAS